MNLDDAIMEAIALKQQVQGQDLAPVFARMNEEMERLSGEMDVSTLLPGGPDAELGMAAKAKNSREFYDVFKTRIRANLCAKEGEFSKLIQSGIQTSVGAVIATLAATLSLPAVALPLLVSIAVIISHSGLEAFCEPAGKKR